MKRPRRHCSLVLMLILGMWFTTQPSGNFRAIAAEEAMPELIGEWQGDWGGIPVKIAITGQEGSQIRGTMTVDFKHYGRDSGSMNGSLGVDNGQTVLSIDSTIHGRPNFKITKVTPSQLEGYGIGRRHRGKVLLSRR